MTNWQDILERAGWTVAQAFTGSLTAIPIAQLFTDLDISGGETALLAACGASVAALLSFVKTLAQERLGVIETRKAPEYLP